MNNIINTGKDIEIPQIIYEENERIVRMHYMATWKGETTRKVHLVGGGITNVGFGGGVISEAGDVRKETLQSLGILILTNKRLIFYEGRGGLIRAFTPTKIFAEISLKDIMSLNYRAKYAGCDLELSFHEGNQIKRASIDMVMNHEKGWDAQKLAEDWINAITGSINITKKELQKPSLTLKEKLRLLEERLLKGEISEELYKEMNKKIELEEGTL